MSNRVFIIADTHFGHKNVIQFEAEHRPFSTIEEHDDELVRRWNDTVRKNDTVWHLGDVLFGEAAFDTLARLNGVKRLVLGNHDGYPAEKYLQHFSSVHGCVRLRGCIFTHMPVHPAQLARYRANIHGHTHHYVIDDARYVCVSVEQTGLAPVLLDTVMLRVPAA